MGYRSNVRIVTTRNGFNELKKFTDKYLKDNNYNYGNLLDNLDISHETKHAKYFGWNAIKWYDGIEGYKDVDAIVDGLNHLEKNNYSYRFARIGEEYDDYQELSYTSERKNEQDLEYPSMTRYFEDDWVIQNMDKDQLVIKKDERDER